MAINFPNSPTLNQTFTNGSDTWIWNGSSWTIAPVSSPTFTGITAGTVAATTITGALTGNVTGNVTGNSTTATRLATARTINGTNFDGSANITVTAAAGTLTGTTLNSTVANSNLTSVGTLTDLEVTGDITADSNVVVAAAPTNITHATNKKYVDTRSIAMSIAMS